MSDNPIVAIPELCARHQHDLVVRQLRIPETGPWGTTLLISQILLFTASTTNEKIWRRCSPNEDGTRDSNDLSIVLAEIGCLACFDYVAYNRVITLFRKHDLSYVAKVSRGLIRDDPDWPYLEEKPK